MVGCVDDDGDGGEVAIANLLSTSTVELLLTSFQGQKAALRVSHS